MNKSVKSLLLRTLLRSGEDASLGGSNLTAATPDNDAEFVTPPDSLPKLRDDNLQLAAHLRETSLRNHWYIGTTCTSPFALARDATKIAFCEVGRALGSTR